MDEDDYGLLDCKIQDALQSDYDSDCVDRGVGTVAGSNVLCQVCGQWCPTYDMIREHASSCQHHSFYAADPREAFLCRLCRAELNSPEEFSGHRDETGHSLFHRQAQMVASTVEMVSVEQNQGDLDTDLYMEGEDLSGASTSVSHPAGMSDSDHVHEDEMLLNIPENCDQGTVLHSQDQTAVGIGLLTCAVCGETCTDVAEATRHMVMTGHTHFNEPSLLLPANETIVEVVRTADDIDPRPSIVGRRGRTPATVIVVPGTRGGTRTSTRGARVRGQTATNAGGSQSTERNTSLSICVQCGKWFPGSGHSPQAQQHTAFSGHSLFLPVKEKSGQTEFRCLVCGLGLRLAHQAAVHMVHTGHDQFASVCLPAREAQTGAVRTGRVMGRQSNEENGNQGPRSGPARSVIEGNLPGPEDALFRCNYCSSRFTRSAELPDHHSRTGHARFMRVVPCATGMAVETWNQSGRMIRGQVMPSASSSEVVPPPVVSQAGTVNGGVASSSASSSSATSSLRREPISTRAGGDVSSTSVPLLPDVLLVHRPTTGYQSVHMIVSAEIQPEVDYMVSRVTSLYREGYSVGESISQCALCSRCFTTPEHLVRHASTQHLNPADVLERMAYFVRMQLDYPGQMKIDYACMLCAVGLRPGMENVEGNITPSACLGDHCLFACASNLPEHVASQHTVACPGCPGVLLRGMDNGIKRGLSNCWHHTGCSLLASSSAHSSTAEGNTSRRAPWTNDGHTLNMAPMKRQQAARGGQSLGRGRGRKRAAYGMQRSTRVTRASLKHSVDEDCLLDDAPSEEDISLVSADHVMNHEEVEEDEEEAYRCNYCAREESTLDGIRAHTSRCPRRPRRR